MQDELALRIGEYIANLGALNRVTGTVENTNMYGSTRATGRGVAKRPLVVQDRLER